MSTRITRSVYDKMLVESVWKTSVYEALEMYKKARRDWSLGGVRVMFKNAGNFQEVKVPVFLTVDVFNKPVLTKKQTVLSVDKGATASVDFGNLQLPTKAFAAQASVNVRVGKVPGETNLDNNKASYAVFFSVSSNP